MENYQIDNLDRKILAIIKKNARTPFLEVGRACDVSGAAVHQRVQRLIKEGIIAGAEFVLDPAKVGYHTCAYMGIFLDKASLVNLTPVYVIHGHGSGVLKSVINDFLSTSPYVAKFRFAEPSEGGDGVRVIDIN